MTQQYLVGEVSQLLGQLQAAAPHSGATAGIGCLRLEAEATSPAGLTPVVLRALMVADGLCWDSLSRGDAHAFSCQAALAADLREFSVCAGLLSYHG